jgi:hypothetical protein
MSSIAVCPIDGFYMHLLAKPILITREEIVESRNWGKQFRITDNLLGWRITSSCHSARNTWLNTHTNIPQSPINKAGLSNQSSRCYGFRKPAGLILTANFETDTNMRSCRAPVWASRQNTSSNVPSATIGLPNEDYVHMHQRAKCRCPKKWRTNASHSCKYHNYQSMAKPPYHWGMTF